ncbi:MAG: HipA family kinase [Terriglobales bacterium]
MKPLTAAQHVRRMRGGSQAQLLRASDSHLYVVKFTNNPQGVRILANDWIASRLARRIELPVPEVAAVEISPWLIRSTPELFFELSSGRAACNEGVHFGSRFAVNPQDGIVTDLLPAACLPRVTNLAAFIGALVLDKWTCNTDRRQAVYVRTDDSAGYSAVLIDQGHCFNATNWNFPDSPLYGLYGSRDVYLQVTSWESFEPWLTCVETLDAQELLEIANSASPVWYDHDELGLAQLVSQLILRQRYLRRIIADLEHSTVNPFPNWRQSASSYAAASASSRALQKPVPQSRSKTVPINKEKP